MHKTSAQTFWDHCLSHFQARLPANEFNTWVKPISIELNNESILALLAPNRYLYEFFEQRYLSQVQKFAEEMNLSYEIQLKNATPTVSARRDNPLRRRLRGASAPAEETVSPAKIPEPSPSPTPEPTKSVESKPVSESAPSPVPQRRLDDKTGLNRSMTFETLVTGKANELALSAAKQVLLQPGKIYNPLFIYGATSLGKTHLMQAIGNKIAQQQPDFRIRYIESESFYREYSRAIGRNAIDEFKRYFHSLDFFLIDDIQFLGKKFSTQDEFFHTFNTLLYREKQIIITSDTYPKDIQDLKERVVSRFGGGLTVMLEPPELEMRVDILHKKSAAPEIDLQLTDEAAFFIARHIRSNARELEGALNKVKAYAAFIFDDCKGKTIGIEVIREALSDILHKHHALITIENIQKTVADYYRIKVSDLYSKSRQQRIARPRQLAMALARDLTQYSLPQIGENFGGRDHTTVIHACKAIEKLRAQDAALDHDYHVLRQTLKGGDD